MSELSQKLQTLGIFGAPIGFAAPAALQAEGNNSSTDTDVVEVQEPKGPPVAIAPGGDDSSNVESSQAKRASDKERFEKMMAEADQFPERTPEELAELEKVRAEYTKEQVIEAMTSMLTVQRTKQEKLTVEAKRIVKELDQKSGTKKKKTKELTLMQAYDVIVGLDLPKEPFNDATIQKLVAAYETDPDVAMAAQDLMVPQGKGCPERAAKITMEKIIEVHQFMVNELQKLVTDFSKLPRTDQIKFQGRVIEAVAELMVSVAVERLGEFRSEDLDQAVAMNEVNLSQNQDFFGLTHALTELIARLNGLAEPAKVDKETFIKIINELAESARKTKRFSNNLVDEYRTKKINVEEAYNKYESMHKECTPTNAEGLPDLTFPELEVCFSEYKDDPEALKAYEQFTSCNTEMGTISGSIVGGVPSIPTGPPEATKKKAPKASEVVDMHVFLVEEMRILVEAVEKWVKRDKFKLNDEAAQGFISSMAQGLMEKKFGFTSAEIAAFAMNHVAFLQRNQRFGKAMADQQNLSQRMVALLGGGITAE